MRLPLIGIMLAVLLLAVPGCEPYSDPSPTSIPSGPSEAWRGTYRGEGLFSSPAYGISNQPVSVSVACNPAGNELNIELHITSAPAAYSPNFRRTGPVADETAIYWFIERDVFVYHASLGRNGDRIGGLLLVRDLAGGTVWQLDSINASRD